MFKKIATIAGGIAAVGLGTVLVAIGVNMNVPEKLTEVASNLVEEA